MDKQRLLELAGVTEARYASQPSGYVLVYVDQYGSLEIEGPFPNEKDATRYREFKIEKFNYTEKEAGRVLELMSPETL